MEVKLLKELINDAINEPNEDIREGDFWCYAPDYDKCIPVLKKIFFDEKIEEIKSAECNIQRINGQFLIEDSYGKKDLFTKEEISLFIALWEKAQTREVNNISL